MFQWLQCFFSFGKDGVRSMQGIRKQRKAGFRPPQTDIGKFRPLNALVKYPLKVHFDLNFRIKFAVEFAKCQSRGPQYSTNKVRMVVGGPSTWFCTMASTFQLRDTHVFRFLQSLYSASLIPCADFES